MTDLLDLVLRKRELSGIDRGFAGAVLEAWLRRHPQVRAAYEADPQRFARKKEFQQLRAGVRSELRRVYGLFFTPQYAAKRERLVEQLVAEPTEERASAALALHRSSAERLPYYRTLYHQLFAVTGEPERILDLGCGFNPLSYPFLHARPAYHCADIACADLGLIARFLQSLHVPHSTHCMDISDPERVASLPEADVAFAFKLFDSLEELRLGVTEKLLPRIPARTLIASFPLASIGGGAAIAPRAWFERLVTGKVVGTVTLPNEQFLIVTLQRSAHVTRPGQ